MMTASVCFTAAASRTTPAGSPDEAPLSPS